MHLYVAPLLLSLLFASVAHAQYVGVTVDVFGGDQGIFAYNRACHAAHPGSRMCTTEEVGISVNPPIVGSPGEFAWVKTTNPAWPLINGENCNAWTETDSEAALLKLEDGTLAGRGCDVPRRVACCIPVPEPSASLTIPSGVGMLLALAKLRAVELIQ